MARQGDKGDNSDQHPNIAVLVERAKVERNVSQWEDSLQPWQPLASCWNGWLAFSARRGEGGGERERERDSQPEPVREPRTQPVHQTERGGGEGRDTYLSVYPNLNDSSEGTEQSKRDRC